jgi:hypothetical protein
MFLPRPFHAVGVIFAVRVTAFLYRCPTTGQNVQGFVLDRPSEPRDDVYESVVCTACRGVHLVNPATGHVAGVGEKPERSAAQ